MHLGRCLTRLKRFDEAETLLQSALATRRKAFGSDSWQAAETQVHLAALSRAQGQTASATAMFAEAIARLTARFGVSHPLTRMAERERSRFGRTRAG